MSEHGYTDDEQEFDDYSHTEDLHEKLDATTGVQSAVIPAARADDDGGIDAGVLTGPVEIDKVGCRHDPLVSEGAQEAEKPAAKTSANTDAANEFTLGGCSDSTIPELDVQDGSDELDSRSNLATWTEYTRSQLGLAMSLREELNEKMYTPLVQSKETGSTNAALRQEQLRREIETAERANRILFHRIEQTSQSIQQVGSYVAMMLQAHRAKKPSLKIAEKRLQLRQQRPTKECIEDSVQQALGAEKTALLKCSRDLVKQISTGHELLSRLENIKAQLIEYVQHEREIVKFDRSCLLFDGFHSDDGALKRKAKAQRSVLQSGAMGSLRELFDASANLLDTSAKFGQECASLIQKIKRVIDRLAVDTNKSIKARILETAEFKRRLEKEVLETGTTIKKMQQSLDLMRNQLEGNQITAPKIRSKLSVFLEQTTERINIDGLEAFETLGSGSVTQCTLDKAMGLAGDKMNITGLQKADRVITPHADLVAQTVERIDSELASAATRPVDVTRRLRQLSVKLHGQEESIAEELESIRAAKSVLTEALQQRMEWAEEKLEHLVKVTLPNLEADLEDKTAAWKIDLLCFRVSPSNVDGLRAELDSDNASSLGTRPSTCKSRNFRPFSKPLTADSIVALREKARAASYIGTSGSELDVIFARVDKDGSGYLDEAELRMALRRTLRITPSIISDAQISTLFSMIDKDFSGKVSIVELIEFLGAEPEFSKRTGRPFHGPMLDVGWVDANVALPDATPRKRTWENAKPRAYRPPMKKAALEEVRKQIKAAAYTGVFGKQLDVIFTRFDKDGSGMLEDHEIKSALRRALKLPPSVISDAQISDLCATLDSDCSGAVSIQELLDFVGNEPAVSPRTGRKMQTTLEEASAFLQEEAFSLPVVSPGRPLTGAAQ